MPSPVLRGIRVLDFTWVLAGPYASRILADFGAEVIKVQSRAIASGTERNATGYFNTWNRGKLGITLDLNRAEGRELALRLVAISDVVANSFSPRVMANWGFSYDSLREVKPDLIMLSMSGMGGTGPQRDYAAFGPTVQALSGLTYLTSYDAKSPTGTGYAHADHIAGLYAALAVLIALEHRDKTGKGQYIDISELETMCSLLGPSLMDCSINGAVPHPQGNHSDYISAAPCGCYRCRGDDKWCVIAVYTEAEWQTLCNLAGNPPWTREPGFATPELRREHFEELDMLLEQWMANYSPQELVPMLQQAGIAAGEVKDAGEVARDPQLVSRNFFVDINHPVLGKTRADGTPIILSRTPAQFGKPAPLLGEDNRYVFQELLGIGETEYKKYVDEGIIG